jgi:hypothetical protein
MSTLVIHFEQTAESTAQSVRDWVIAVGTFLAAFAAVWVGIVREWWRRPALSLEHRDSSHGDDVVARTPKGYPWAWLRLCVHAGRRSAAEDVEVMILAGEEVETRDGGHVATPLPLGGQLLVWSHTGGDWPTPGSPRVTIPAGTYRLVDLLYVDQRENGRSALAHLAVAKPPTDDRLYQVSSRRFRLTLSVQARNVPARLYRLEVRWDGVWDEDDEPWRHLAVESVVHTSG